MITDSSKDTDRIPSQLAFDEAKEKDLLVMVPSDHELVLDLDTPEQIKHFLEKWPIWSSNNRLLNYRDIRWTQSKTGGVHVWIWLKTPQKLLDRLLLQLVLGSDRTREYISWIRVGQNDPHPTLSLEANPVNFRPIKELTVASVTKGQIRTPTPKQPVRSTASSVRVPRSTVTRQPRSGLSVHE